MSDFKEIARMLLSEKGGFQIQSADALFDAVRSLLDNPSEARAMGERAFRFFSSNRGATERTVNMVASYIGQADAS
jgi:3-deoxy-D-manno-octulosonic-acid transferase